MHLGASRPGRHAAGPRLERPVRHRATDTAAMPLRLARDEVTVFGAEGALTTDAGHGATETV